MCAHTAFLGFAAALTPAHSRALGPRETRFHGLGLNILASRSAVFQTEHSSIFQGWPCTPQEKSAVKTGVYSQALGPPNSQATLCHRFTPHTGEVSLESGTQLGLLVTPRGRWHRKDILLPVPAGLLAPALSPTPPLSVAESAQLTCA